MSEKKKFINRTASDSVTLLPKAMLQDERLSFAARGLLAKLLSFSDDDERGDALVDYASVPAFRELEEAGYVTCQTKNMPTAASPTVWVVRDTPVEPEQRTRQAAINAKEFGEDN